MKKEKQNLQKLRVWDYKDIPLEVRDGSNTKKVKAFFGGLVDGSVAITEEALTRLVGNNKENND